MCQVENEDIYVHDTVRKAGHKSPPRPPIWTWPDWLEPVLCYPPSHLFGHGKTLSGIAFIAAAERISIHFQRYRLVAASLDKSKYVKLGKTRNAKLPVLFHVYKFVKKQTICEMDMGHNFV